VNKGTGLGLSQVYGFAHQSGGTVTIDSTFGEGTRVTLYLPRASELPQTSVADEESEAAAGGRALLVEDNPEVSEVSAELLQQLGYQVHSATDAETALAALDTQQFDLVVSDIVMAGTMDGMGLARAIRDGHPTLPIVLVTGYSRAATQAASEFTLLRKPYQLAEMSRALARAMAETREPKSTNVVRLRDAARNSGQT
jgi:CheY-like chemotaxis protein